MAEEDKNNHIAFVNGIPMKEWAQEKLAEDFKKLYGVDYTPENIEHLTKEGKIVTLVDAEKALSNRKALNNYSTVDLAKLQFAVHQAGFELKYGNEQDQAITNRRKKIVENKDNMNDAILNKMEGYATGVDKISGDDYKNYQLEKDSFNLLCTKAPAELRKHCWRTLATAYSMVNTPKNAVSASRLSHAVAQKLKYKSMEIHDGDSLWTMAKKTAKMKGFTVSRTAKKGIKKWWKKSLAARFLRAMEKQNNALKRHDLHNANRLSLFPSRTKKAIKKFWSEKIAGPLKKKWKEKIADPFKTKVAEPAKKWINSKIVEPVKRGAQWVKDNPKKVMAGAFMVASIGIGTAVAGPAGALAGAKFGAMSLAGATATYGSYKAAKWTYNKSVELKNNVVKNTKESLKKSFQKNQEKIPDVRNNSDKEKSSIEIAYAMGRKVFNENPKEMNALLDSYKKGISPEGNEGKPLTEKEAAIKMYQTMISNKDKGGMGFSQESAQAVMSYFKENKTIASGFEDIKDEINKPVSEKEGDTRQEPVSQPEPLKETEQPAQEKPKEQEIPQLNSEQAKLVESQLNVLKTLGQEGGLKPTDDMYKSLVDTMEKGFAEKGITAEQMGAIREQNPTLFPAKEKPAPTAGREQEQTAPEVKPQTKEEKPETRTPEPNNPESYNLAGITGNEGTAGTETQQPSKAQEALNKRKAARTPEQEAKHQEVKKARRILMAQGRLKPTQKPTKVVEMDTNTRNAFVSTHQQKRA